MPLPIPFRKNSVLKRCDGPKMTAHTGVEDYILTKDGDVILFVSYGEDEIKILLKIDELEEMLKKAKGMLPKEVQDND